jgi:hypothetical protein
MKERGTKRQRERKRQGDTGEKEGRERKRDRREEERQGGRERGGGAISLKKRACLPSRCRVLKTSKPSEMAGKNNLLIKVFNIAQSDEMCHCKIW